MTDLLPDELAHLRDVAAMQARHGNRYATVPARALQALLDAYDARGREVEALKMEHAE